MNHPKVSKEDMLKRVMRFKQDINKENAIPLMFIDSLLPGHHRLNYAVVGDTAMPDGNGPAYHTHDYIECFFPLEGKWRFWFGNDPDTEPVDYVDLEKWDLISLPPGLWRRFENIGSEPAWCFAVLEAHEVFEGKDPYWSSTVIRKAKEMGFESDDEGRMTKPDNFNELNAEMLEKMFNA